MDTVQTPRRQRTRCAREGCDRFIRSGKTYRHCSLMCAELDMEMTRTIQLCQALGGTPLSAELWANLVEVNDRWSEVVRLRYELWLAAKSVGIMREQWQAIKRGHNPNGDN